MYNATYKYSIYGTPDHVLCKLIYHQQLKYHKQLNFTTHFWKFWEYPVAAVLYYESQNSHIQCIFSLIHCKSFSHVLPTETRSVYTRYYKIYGRKVIENEQGGKHLDQSTKTDSTQSVCLMGWKWIGNGDRIEWKIKWNEWLKWVSHCCNYGGQYIRIVLWIAFHLMNVFLCRLWFSWFSFLI